MIATKKQVAPKFDPSNIKGSLTERYKNDPVLAGSEITDISKIMLRNGGLPTDEELENEIEARYNSNPNFKKELDTYFAQPSVIKTKDSTVPKGEETDTVQDTTNTKEVTKDLTRSNLDTVWQLKGLQMEAPAYTNDKVQVIERKDSILKKSDWFALNTGKIKNGQKVSLEFDTTREYNIKNNNSNQIIIESVVYLDKDTNNKSDSNRIIIGVLPAYTENNKTFSLEENTQLKTLRDQLFNEVKTSAQKTGIITLSPTTTVSRINPARFWNIRDISKHNAPHEILREDEELLFGVAIGKDEQVKLSTNGDPVINLMNPKQLTAGMTYQIIQSPTGEFIPTSTRVKTLGQLENEFKQVKDLIESLKDNPPLRSIILLISVISDPANTGSFL